MELLSGAWPRLGGWALDLVFPRRCAGCGRGGAFLCPPCLAQLPRVEPPLCRRCGLPWGGAGVCPACYGDWPALGGLRAPLLLEGLAREVVHQLKYNNSRALAQPLGGILADYLVVQALPGAALVPVPLHPRRLRERGYNQAELLAREVGRRAGRPVLAGALRRERLAAPQARAGSAAQRAANVRGAFRAEGNLVQGQTVLLIDDVATTGATLGACAQALREA
ncbi:MAG: ComF family protein, partial [Chloroflexi bacterium]|nr:ComF family protein [Chloroflexota bacterium]